MLFNNCIRFLVVFLVSSIAYSQNNEPIVFGKPNYKEVIAKSCELDSSAEAELLYDKENIVFFINEYSQYAMKTTYHGRLKIYKKSGLDRGTIKVTQKKRNGDSQTIENIKGYTYNIDSGKITVTNLEPSSIFKEKINDYQSVTKIIAPNLKEGSVFDYTYTYITPFSVSDKPNNWYFQGAIPYRYSDITITIPGRFLYKLFYRGYLTPFINETKDTIQDFGSYKVQAVKYHLATKDAPALSDEPYVTSNQDIIAKLEFEMASYTAPFGGEEHVYTKTWSDINKLLLDNENFGERLNGNGFLKELASKFENISDTLEKINAVLRYVTQTMKWNGNSYLYINQKLSKVFENKIGTNVELNFILIALLRRLNINSNPAILSTKSNGEVNESFPLLDRFNYTVAQVRVGGKDMILDATDRFAKPNMLPYRCITNKIFVVEKDHGRFIPYQSKEKKVEIESIDYTIIPDSNLIKANYSTSMGGYKALEYRNFIYNNGEEELEKHIENSDPAWQIKNIKVENKDSIIEPLKITYNFLVNSPSQKKELIYFNPFFNHRVESNPFMSESRIYPIDFVLPIEDITSITIKIPEGYKLDEKPKSGTFVLPEKAGKFSYLCELENDIIKIRSQISISKRIFSPTEYSSLKQLYNAIIDKQAQQIILRKN